ncbi:MAG: FHA domain-containing protein [Myxococcaceae bacterium]|nr:FHA domain-containing protein [Myxococcaceae bacterium]
MGVPAYMLSILHRQALLLNEGFSQRYGHDWLVWEPGPWKPARSVLESNLEKTILPNTKPLERPVGEDAICFELKLPKGATSLKVGRATTNDLVINDLTASREQFSLQWTREGWFVVAPRGLLTLDGAPVEGSSGPLRSGALLTLGDVRLSFLVSGDLGRRAAAFKLHRSA